MSKPAVSMGQRICYALPFIGVGGLQFFTAMYLMKYATDRLLIAPAIMGAIFGIVRVTDALSDPLIGHLSDGTRTRWGRRLPWVVLAIVPGFAAAFALWAPPALSPAGLVAWMAVAMLLYSMSMTSFTVPHESWGTELSSDRHERTGIYAFRQVAFLLGMVFGIAAVGAIIDATDPRQVAIVAVGAMCAIAVLGVGLLVRFVPKGHARVPKDGRLWSALRGVAKNRHARLLLVIRFIERIGTASLSALGGYVAQYIVGDESVLPILLGCFAAGAFIAIPVATRLTRRFDKRAVWMASMGLSIVGFSSLYFVRHGDLAWLCCSAAIAGIGDTCGSVVGSSMLGDVVDADELATGERREGALFALAAAADKGAYGAGLLLTGAALQIAGYVPGQAQTPATESWLRFQLSLLPVIGYVCGLLLLRRYRFGEREHHEVLRQLRDVATKERPA